MEAGVIDRRTFLATTALAGADFAVGIGPARAFTLEEPSKEIADLYAAARSCGAGYDHDRLLAEIRSALEGQDLSDDQERRVLAAVTCPLCGCPASRF